MTTKWTRSRFLAGCLATLLLAAPLALAQTRIDAGRRNPIRGGAETHAGSLWAALAAEGLLWTPSDRTAPTSTNDATPWSRRTFVSFQVDGARATEAALKPPPAVTLEQPPGVVQNLRRADKR